MVSKVALFNVKYSPNLGDGLLSECLESALVAQGADAAFSIDLATRSTYGAPDHARSAKLALLDRLPARMRRAAVATVLQHKSRGFRAFYAQGLQGAQLAVIGGGGLFADMDLNFPLKILSAANEIAAARLPSAVYGVGVSSAWSAKGRDLFRQALDKARPVAVWVRDRESKANWEHLVGRDLALPAQLCRDPGLLAKSVWPHLPGEPNQKTVGICLMSPTALTYHGHPPQGHLDLGTWFEELLHLLLSEGRKICVFTNGSPEDRAFAARFRVRFQDQAAAGTMTFDQPETPARLCHLIAGLQGLIAFRMHAVIAAYSYAIPAIGLRWDPKLDAFMRSVERGHAVLDCNQATPHEAVGALLEAMETGIDTTTHRTVLNEAADGARALFQTLRGTLSETATPPRHLATA